MDRKTPCNIHISRGKKPKILEDVSELPPSLGARTACFLVETGDLEPW